MKKVWAGIAAAYVIVCGFAVAFNYKFFFGKKSWFK